MTKSSKFFDKKIREIAKEKIILDIGGGGRFQKELARYEKYFVNSDYKTLDISTKHRPDIVGDVHNLPFRDNSVDAIICKAVLEHTHDPFRAVSEIYRILKPRGKCFVYVPFLYPYHASRTDYKDYYRYTKDGVEHLFRNFSKIEICSVRGYFETMVNLLPSKLLRETFKLPARILDKIFISKNQTSGYNIFLIK